MIRDLDALFAKDPRRASRPSRPAPAAPAVAPEQVARELLHQVAADFRPTPPPAPPRPTAPAPAAFLAAPADVNAPRVVAFVPSPVRQLESTTELALPADDEDLAQLVPWYRRLWNRFFARRAPT